MSLRERLEARREMAEQLTLNQRPDWFVCELPWGDATHVISGNPDPHIAGFVADMRDWNDEDEDRSVFDAMCRAEFVAANDPTTITLMLDCLLAAEQWQELIQSPIPANATWEDRVRRSDECIYLKQREFAALKALHAHLEREGGE